MIPPIIEFVIYLVLFVVLLIMMLTKFNANSRGTKTHIYEKKLDILHKRFLLQNSRKKKNQNASQNNNNNNNGGEEKQVTHITRQQSRCSAVGGIGNFKAKDEQLQNVDLQSIDRLVKLNGDGFKQSAIKDFKLYLRIRENQLEEYQNIIINKRYQDIKEIQYSKWQLAWYLIKLLIMRKNMLFNFLFEKRLGKFHKMGTIFVFILQTLISLTICQSIRRIFQFSWYKLNDDTEDQQIQEIIVGLCILAQFAFTSPVFLLIQIWFNLISSEYFEVKKIIQRKSPPKHCFCVIMSDLGSMNALITAIILIIGVYQGISFNAELGYTDIDFSVFITWISLCILELLIFRNFYIFAYISLKYLMKKDNSIKEELRLTLLIYFLIDVSRNNGKRSRRVSATRRLMIKKMQSNKQQKQDLFEPEEECYNQNNEDKKATEKIIGGQNGIQPEQNKLDISSGKNKKTKNKDGTKVATKSKQIVKQQRGEDDSDSDYEDEDDLELNEEEYDEKYKNNDINTVQEDIQQGNKLQQTQNNNILPHNILLNFVRNKTIEAESNQCNQQQNNLETTSECDKNQQIKKQLAEEMCTEEQNLNHKQINTSFAFDDESAIQYEQPVTLETIYEPKMAKNKVNKSFSHILSLNQESLTNQQSQIYSINGGYKFLSTFIKTFSSGDIIDDEEINKKLPSQIDDKQEKQQNLSSKNKRNNKKEKKETFFNKNDSSFTINREISLKKVNNLEIYQIMTLKDEKKFENDTSFLKNLEELKQIKNFEITGNKTLNEVSIFGNKDTSQFLVNEELFQNNNQKNKNNNNSLSCILNKSELLEFFKPNPNNPEQNL